MPPSSRTAAILLCVTFGTQLLAAPPHPRQEYLDLAKAAYQAGLESTPAAVQKWQETYKPTADEGYAPPDGAIWFARLAATLRKLTATWHSSWWRRGMT